MLHPTHDLYNCRILDLKSIYFYELILYIFKVKHKLIKCNIVISTVSDIHNIETRNRSNFYVTIGRINIVSSNVFHIGARVFNSIPTGLKNENNLYRFKVKLKEYVFANLKAYLKLFCKIYSLKDM